jgi:hypothetical protein
MWPRPHYRDDPFRTPSSEPSAPTYIYRWATRSSRFSGIRLSPVRIGLILIIAVCILLLHDYYIPKTLLDELSLDTRYLAFHAPEASRALDTVDAFQSYKYYNECGISSLDLHAPFSPLCSDRTTMLAAMSSGGRVGFDAPYMPRGCDMHWFTSEEVCEILSRFDRVILVGDSMLRHVIGSINIIVRKDIGYGAVTDWNFSEEERFV